MSQLKKNKKYILCPHCGQLIEVAYFNSRLGKKGGKTTLLRHGKEYFSELGKLSAKKRWG